MRELSVEDELLVAEAIRDGPRPEAIAADGGIALNRTPNAVGRTTDGAQGLSARPAAIVDRERRM